MKRLLLVLLVVGFSWARPDYKLAYVNADDVNLRQGPSAEAPVVARLARGDVLGTLASQGDWIRATPLHVYVRTADLESGGEVFLEPGGAALGRFEPGLEEVYKGQEWSLVEAPATLELWIATRFISRDGVLARETVAPTAFGLPDKDLRKLSVPGLRLLVLPTARWGTPHVTHADTGRFGPSYGVKYANGKEWLKVAGATSGLGGADLGEPLYHLHTPLLGTVIVGTTNYGNSKNWMGLLPPLNGGSTLDKQPCALALFFDCSPGLPEATIREVLLSLRAARL